VHAVKVRKIWSIAAINAFRIWRCCLATKKGNLNTLPRLDAWRQGLVLPGLIVVDFGNTSFEKLSLLDLFMVNLDSFIRRTVTIASVEAKY
jgi:hypothetical protein